MPLWNSMASKRSSVQRTTRPAFRISVQRRPRHNLKQNVAVAESPFEKHGPRISFEPHWKNSPAVNDKHRVKGCRTRLDSCWTV